MRPLIRQPAAGPGARRDPAPSRAAYRLHRLWLTPAVRGLLRVGLPVLAAAASVALWLGDDGRRDALAQRLADLRESFEQRPQFMVGTVAVSGAGALSAEAVAALLPDDLPKSSFDIDLDALRAALEQVPAVARADLRIVSGGVLQVQVAERVPAALWRGPGGLVLLDGAGRPLAFAADRAAYPALPLMAGEGAGEAVAEAMALWAAAAPVAHRVRGLVRMGARRWDVVLDRGQRILLPETAPVAALERIIALDQAREVLARDVTAIDLRLAGRPTLRMSAAAGQELRRIRALQQEGAGR